MAVRAALGAGRGAIARMLLAEGLILGVTASVLALLLTRLTLDALAPVIQQQLGRTAPGGALAFTIDLRTMGLAAGVAILTALMCALVPLASVLARAGLGRPAERQPDDDRRERQPADPRGVDRGANRAVADAGLGLCADAALGGLAAADRSGHHRGSRAQRLGHAAAEQISGRAVARRGVRSDRDAAWRACRRGVGGADDGVAAAAAVAPVDRAARRGGARHAAARWFTASATGTSRR